MTAFLDFHAFAAARGEGLHRNTAVFQRAQRLPFLTSPLGPDAPAVRASPASETARDRVNVSIFRKSGVPQMDEPNQYPEHRPLFFLSRER